MPECARCEQHYVATDGGDPLGAPLDGDDWVCYLCHPRLDPPGLPPSYDPPEMASLRAVEQAYEEGDHDIGAGVPLVTVADRLGVAERTARRLLAAHVTAGSLRTQPSPGLGSAQAGRTTYLPADEG